MTCKEENWIFFKLPKSRERNISGGNLMMNFKRDKKQYCTDICKYIQDKNQHGKTRKNFQKIFEFKKRFHP